jgi:hypothetical protein
VNHSWPAHLGTPIERDPDSFDGSGWRPVSFSVASSKGAIQRDLDRHVAAKCSIARAVHFAHSGRPEQRDDLVRAEPLADQSLGHIVFA